MSGGEHGVSGGDRGVRGSEPRVSGGEHGVSRGDRRVSGGEHGVSTKFSTTGLFGGAHTHTPTAAHAPTEALHGAAVVRAEQRVRHAEQVADDLDAGQSSRQRPQAAVTWSRPSWKLAWATSSPAGPKAQPRTFPAPAGRAPEPDTTSRDL